MVQCYYKRDDQVIRQMNTGVCAGSGSADGHYSCCFPWDECIGEPGVSLCYDKKNTIYYTALCTDQTLEDPVCQKGCDGVYTDRLTYNSTTNSWACCSPDTACSTSFNATLDLPAPEALRQSTMTIVDFIPTTTPTSSTGTATSAETTPAGTTPAGTTSTTSPTAIPSTDGSSSSSLSGGAKAGIGVGVTIGALLIIGAVILFLLRRRRIKHSTDDGTPMYIGGIDDANSYGLQEKDSSPLPNYSSSMPGQYKAELPGRGKTSEMDSGKDGNQRPQELSA